jgi:hypothetical protein
LSGTRYTPLRGIDDVPTSEPPIRTRVAALGIFNAPGTADTSTGSGQTKLAAGEGVDAGEEA